MKTIYVFYIPTIELNIKNLSDQQTGIFSISKWYIFSK